MKYLFGIILLLIIGCSTPSGTGEICAPHTGTYQVSFIENSGTCGALQDTVVNVSGVNAFENYGCSGQADTSSNMCSTKINAACPNNDGSAFRLQGHVDWSPDGNQGYGMVRLNYTFGVSSLCSSTYNIRYIKL